MKKIIIAAVVLSLGLISPFVLANSCKDPVVLVHGNAATPASWDNTFNLLLSQGYSSTDIYRPNWGSKNCASCNNHSGSEETLVRQAINDAIANSCSGQIDVIGHSMGATLAAQQISKLAAASYVDTFVGIAGAFRGLYSCGIYPFNVWSSTCGYYGLSIQSPFLDSLYGEHLGDKIYSIKSNIDQIVCATGVCVVYGVHSSSIWNEDASFTYSLGHFGLQTDTAQKQIDLIQ
ncbi:esterase/lipase family protein [Paraglaciecola psychrophila]|uniref:Lipase, class 2 n=1 Tax=Paraglaciecola psychrophila 170 TaxID=1129794 RepID=K7A0R2_9ALTE|nr:alpha/beta fold hydrolase [Paraglaciecola psychrophila]AGH46879.1 lipase, class 2 [Paraglaciecola psychrophila 170]GAC36007.1 alkaline lipase [Paraglaciecola psychrophila 170]